MIIEPKEFTFCNLVTFILHFVKVLNTFFLFEKKKEEEALIPFNFMVGTLHY